MQADGGIGPDPFGGVVWSALPRPPWNAQVRPEPRSERFFLLALACTSKPGRYNAFSFARGAAWRSLAAAGLGRVCWGLTDVRPIGILRDRREGRQAPRHKTANGQGTGSEDRPLGRIRNATPVYLQTAAATFGPSPVIFDNLVVVRVASDTGAETACLMTDRARRLER